MVVTEAWQQCGGVITIFSCVSTKVHPLLKAYAFPFPLLYFHFLGTKEELEGSSV
jgi:hypothetical protein